MPPAMAAGSGDVNDILNWYSILDSDNRRITFLGPYTISKEDRDLLKKDVLSLCGDHDINEETVEEVLRNLHGIAENHQEIQSRNNEVVLKIQKRWEYNKDIAEAVKQLAGENKSISVYTVRTRRAHGVFPFKLTHDSLVKMLTPHIDGDDQCGVRGPKVGPLVYTFADKDEARAKAVILLEGVKGAAFIKPLESLRGGYVGAVLDHYKNNLCHLRMLVTVTKVKVSGEKREEDF
ncbi:Nn.00g075050.m01.CDS01 [Neocucurbitaria sp. VM-36]